MKPNEEQLTRWIDGTLSYDETREIDAWLAENPQEKRELEEMRAIARGISQAAAPPADVPAAEFFTHQLERRLDEIDQPAAKVEDAASSNLVPWRRYILSSLAAAAVAVFATVITMRTVEDSADTVVSADELGSDLTGVYTPQDSVKVDAFYADDADAQVVILNGLPEVAAEVQIAGFGEAAPKSFYAKAFGSEIEKMLVQVDERVLDLH